MFAGNNRYLGFEPENGMKVIVNGEISVYEPYGSSLALKLLRALDSPLLSKPQLVVEEKGFVWHGHRRN